MSTHLLKPTPQQISDAAIDITQPAHVEVKIREDGCVLWVNVNGICVLRICRAAELVVDDWQYQKLQTMKDGNNGSEKQRRTRPNRNQKIDFVADGQ